MLTNIICPACGKEYAYGPQLAGKNVRCVSCGHTFLVRQPQGPGAGLEIIGLLADPGTRSDYSIGNCANLVGSQNAKSRVVCKE